MSKKAKPKKQQVQAWLYAVIGPAIPRLAIELSFLGQKNPTWRFKARRCEFLRPVAEYVLPTHEPTLAQYRRFDDDAEARIGRHDRLLKTLEERAAAAHERFRGLAAAGDLVRVLEERFPDWRGAYPREDGPSVLAQCVINWARHPEPGLIDSTVTPAWQVLGARAVSLRGEPAVASAFEELDRTIDEMGEATQELRRFLESSRDAYADRYGIPPVTLAEVEDIAPSGSVSGTGGYC